MSIKNKLFLLIIIPVTAIIIFSVNHIIDTRTYLQNQNNILKSSTFIISTSKLLHELQYQRGLSSSLLNTKKRHFKKLLIEQDKETKKAFLIFLKSFKLLNQEEVYIQNKNMFLDLESDFNSLNILKNDILDLKIDAEGSFDFFTHLNADLLELVKHTTLYSADKETYNNIRTLKQLIIFREFAGQERALVPMLNIENYLSKYMRLYYGVIEAQSKNIKEIQHAIAKNILENKINLIINDKQNIYIDEVRQEIKGSIPDEVDIAKWIKVSTNRIDKYYNFEKELFEIVKDNLIKERKTLEQSIFIQVIFTTITILILLIGSYLIARDINTNLNSLTNGINSFFDYLNFKTKNLNFIQINSKDELNEIAQNINNQINLLNSNLKEDKDFINELTQITTLMQDGDFTEKPYFEPKNPNLIELKKVFNELITIITDKIKEQTKELETINATLEDEVYHQNLELEKQLLDVTRARDKAIDAQKSKDDFLANMSHEIRTPLNAILGFVTILQKRVTDSKNSKYLNIIQNSGKSLLSIINDILDFSKIQSGKFEITPIDINPMEELSNTTLLFASKAYEKYIVYAVYIDPNLPSSLHVDIVRIKQILSNLLSNAIKFTPRDGTLKVRVLMEGEDLVISVQDSGIGIEEKNIKKIFSAFEQADGSTTRKYGGTGLGLSISAKLAKLMNGKLTVESTFLKGSIFTLRLPVKVSNSERIELLDIAKLKNYRFALLNTTKDSEIFIRVIKKYLKDFGIDNIVEIDEYTEDGYDIIFFVPNDDYNEDIIDAKKPSIVLLRSNEIKLADFDFITPLYAPFAPTSVIQAIDDITVENIQDIALDVDKKEDIEEDEEVLFSGNVLIAEDNKTNQMLIKLILMDYELDFKIANDGVQAVKMFKEEKFDLVLMDENMPNLNGIEAMKQIKEYEIDNNIKHTPVIAVTANALKTDVDRFLKEGMDGFVAKPIDTKLLEIELDKYLKRA